MAYTLSSTDYNLNPSTQSGSGAYGSVPGAISVAPSIWAQTDSAVPGTASTGSSVLSNIQKEVAGQLSSGSLNLLKNQSATYGATSGMSGSGVVGNDYLKSLGLTSESLTQKGTSDYLSFLSGVGNTQTDPALATEVASRNATMAAAPNPTEAASAEQSLFQQYLSAMQTGSGGRSFSYSPAGNTNSNLFSNASTNANNTYQSNLSNFYGQSPSRYSYYET